MERDICTVLYFAQSTTFAFSRPWRGFPVFLCVLIVYLFALPFCLFPCLVVRATFSLNLSRNIVAHCKLKLIVARDQLTSLQIKCCKFAESCAYGWSVACI